MVELPEILFQEEKDSYDLTTKLKFLSVLAQLNNKAGESAYFLWMIRHSLQS